MHIALYRPEIPPNTGNISRLCVGLDIPLHIIGKPAFDMDEKSVRRAGLDHWKDLTLYFYEDFNEFFGKFSDRKNIYLVTKFAKNLLFDRKFSNESVFVFGNETSGLPGEIHEEFNDDQKIRIPIHGPVRSLNLSNAVAVVAYEAFRQISSEI
ncbi:MAG: tRNA (cytidine(34)-2'-O)-methyltransferase [Leptospiraceae bacterium]|nr:tRNA (cytidine(34)-2'-O)-methyltransferase [Leptospiraceae bacterium]MCP5512905.1 tRNA (cytidine(34)-2'-O)-methyltransferase [Leptospiraceae bacterium]